MFSASSLLSISISWKFSSLFSFSIASSSISSFSWMLSSLLSFSFLLSSTRCLLVCCDWKCQFCRFFLQPSSKGSSLGDISAIAYMGKRPFVMVAVYNRSSPEEHPTILVNEKLHKHYSYSIKFKIVLWSDLWPSNSKNYTHPDLPYKAYI